MNFITIMLRSIEQFLTFVTVPTKSSIFNLMRTWTHRRLKTKLLETIFLQNVKWQFMFLFYSLGSIKKRNTFLLKKALNLGSNNIKNYVKCYYETTKWIWFKFQYILFMNTWIERYLKRLNRLLFFPKLKFSKMSRSVTNNHIFLNIKWFRLVQETYDTVAKHGRAKWNAQHGPDFLRIFLRIGSAPLFCCFGCNAPISETTWVSEMKPRSRFRGRNFSESRCCCCCGWGIEELGISFRRSE